MSTLHVTAELLFAAIIVGAVVSIVRDIRAGLRDLASFKVPPAPSDSTRPPAVIPTGNSSDRTRRLEERFSDV